MMQTSVLNIGDCLPLLMVLFYHSWFSLSTLFFVEDERNFCPSFGAITKLFCKSFKLEFVHQQGAHFPTPPSAMDFPEAAILPLEIPLCKFVVPAHAIIEEVKALILFIPIRRARDVIIQNFGGALFAPFLPIVEPCPALVDQDTSDPERKQDHAHDLVTILVPPLARLMFLLVALHCLDNFGIHHG